MTAVIVPVVLGMFAVVACCSVLIAQYASTAISDAEMQEWREKWN